MRRIARLVCADLSEVREQEIYEIAEQVNEKQVSTLLSLFLKLQKGMDLIRLQQRALENF